MFKLGCAQLPGFDCILTYFLVLELYLRTCCHLQSRLACWFGIPCTGTGTNYSMSHLQLTRVASWGGTCSSLEGRSTTCLSLAAPRCKVQDTEIVTESS